MKKLLVVVAGLGLVTGLIWMCLGRSGPQKRGPAKPLFTATPAVQVDTSSNVSGINGTTPPVAAPALMQTSEWFRYKNARQAALAANPKLLAEYDQILKDMNAGQARQDAAMLKADPKLGPVLTKLAALRQKNTGVPATSTTSGAPLPTVAAFSAALTADDMQELRAARAKALQADPTLITDAKKQADKMRDFETKLDATMVKLDPNAAVVIAKFEERKPAEAPGQLTRLEEIKLVLIHSFPSLKRKTA